MTFTEQVRVGALAFLIATPALAQSRSAVDIASARALFNDGIELRKKGDLKGALEKLRAAHALGNTPITGIELCRTHAALRQPVEAREVCLGVGRIPQSSQETARSQEARAEAPRIAEAERAKMATLRLRLTGVAPGAAPTVTVDDAAVPTAALGQPRTVDPGAHVITAKAEGPESRTTFEVTEGETRDVELAVLPPADTHARPAPVVRTEEAPSPSGRSYALPITLLAVGGAALLVGAVSGLVASADKSDLASLCTDKQCGREYHDELSTAKVWGNVSTGMFIAGGVLAAGGLVVLFLHASKPRHARIAPTIGLGSVGLHGSF